MPRGIDPAEVPRSGPHRSWTVVGSTYGRTPPLFPVAYRHVTDANALVKLTLRLARHHSELSGLCWLDAWVHRQASLVLAAQSMSALGSHGRLDHYANDLDAHATGC